MYQLVYKQENEAYWNYSDWVINISDLNNKYKASDFFIQDTNYAIVYSS